MPFKISRPYLALGAGVFLFAMAFALYTQHAWEDWYITFKASKNLATGHGLGFTPDAPLHTFTSVLGTLIPALLSFVTFNVSDDLVLWLFRILNAALLAFSVVVLARSAEKWFAWLPAAVLLIGVFALDTKTIDFAINGMETPYTLLALVLFFYWVTVHPVGKLRIKLALVWALLEYARPDGFIYALLLMAAMLLFLGERKETAKTLFISGLGALLIFSPWLLFTLWYYGTPVPHSIIAKGALEPYDPADLAAKVWTFLQSPFLFRTSVLDAVFTPPYCYWFDIPWMLKVSRGLTFVASLLWLLPWIKPLGRIASFACLGFLIYLSAFAPVIYPWYLPGPALLALVALAFGLDAALERFRGRPKEARWLGWSASGLFLAYMLAMTLIAAHQFRRMQIVVERGQREKIGLWLRENAGSSDETIFLECVGYVGFYSGLKTYDFPGMTSAEVVSARKIVRNENWLELVKRLQPDWLVLRYSELNRMLKEDEAYVTERYTPEKMFDVNPDVDKIRFKPYEQYFRIDAAFVVLKKNAL